MARQAVVDDAPTGDGVHGDVAQSVAQAASHIRERIAKASDKAPELRKALAQVEALRATIAVQHRQQGGVLSAEQQARAMFRLAAILQSAS